MTAPSQVVGLAIRRRPRRVALAGNPNVGKSSLFNALTGLRQKVTNYPGTTVERVVGRLHHAGSTVDLVDLPGAYSLLPRSPDEAVARDEILGRVPDEPPPDVVVVVVDAANLERNLLFTTQVIDTGRPVVVALNQVDLALERGISIDAAALAEALGVPVVPTCGRTGQGRDALADAVMKGGGRGRPLALEFPPAVAAAAAELAPHLAGRLGGAERARALLPGILCSEAAARELVETLRKDGRTEALAAADGFRAARARLAESGVDVATAAAEARFAAVERIAARVTRRETASEGWRRRLDRLLTHRVTGSAVLLAVFAFLFLVVFSFSQPLIDLVDGGVSAAGAWAGGLLGRGLLADFVENGVVKGLGAFLVFVPQIALLFVCIETLEDSGYLARAAYLLDRAMGKAGLPGRAFLPLLSGFACAIPGVMATRTIANVRDRLVTMAVLPLMSCSARLPVYAVVTGALFAGMGWWVPVAVVASMYLLGITVALLASSVLRRTVLRGGRTPLLLELPPYRVPGVRSVVRNTVRRTWAFVAGAGPIILVCSMALWALATFPRAPVAAAGADADASQATAAASGRLAHSYLGRAGKFLEPALRPAGFDWKIGVGILSSFAAREQFVPTLGVIYAVGNEADEEDAGLLDSIRNDRWPDGRPIFTPVTGIALLVFYVLALQCMSTLAILRRETNSWRWPVGLFLALMVAAYVASVVTYQVGTALGF